MLINLNATVYVNVTPLKNEFITKYNNSIELAVTGSSSYIWYPDTFLNKTTGSCTTASTSSLAILLKNVTSLNDINFGILSYIYF
jgi:hypothetical protein